jgi:flagellar hook assembly protein FlgD
MAAGERSMAWDGHYDTGRPLASGVYQLRATAGLQSASRKILLLH